MIHPLLLIYILHMIFKQFSNALKELPYKAIPYRIQVLAKKASATSAGTWQKPFLYDNLFFFMYMN